MDKEIKLKATHKGNFKDEFGIDVDCYILNDLNKTAVISSRGMGSALTLTGGGSTALSRFVGGKSIGAYIGPKLREKLDNPLIFKTSVMVQNPSLEVVAKGYDVTILIDVCKAIIASKSDGNFNDKRRQTIVNQAQVISTASSKVGITNLAYALSGYDVTRQQIIESFKFFVREEARQYEQEFPDQLYDEWYRLYELPKPKRNKPWKFKHLTMEQVYYPLAKSKGLIQEFIISQKLEKKERNKRLHQFLSEIGVKALRQHLGQLLGIAQVSKNEMEYEKNFTKVFGGQSEPGLELPDENLSDHNKKLKKAIEYKP